MEKTLFERIGGDQIVQCISDQFYARILLDDRVNHLFHGLDVPRLVVTEQRFLTHVLGGLIRRGERPRGFIQRTVLERGFNHRQFDVLMEQLRATLTELGVNQDEANEVMWRVENTKLGLLGADPSHLEEKVMLNRISVFVYGVVAYALGMASLAYLAGFVGNFLIPTATLDAPGHGEVVTSVAINLSLLCLFAIQHSVMARPTFKKIWTRLIPETVERSTYVLFSALALVPVFLFWQPIGFVLWQVESPVMITLVYSVYALGWLIVVFSTFLINHFDLFGLRQVWLNLRGKTYTHLRFDTPFLYRLVRHPLYFGWLIVMWAAPTMTISHLVFAFALTVYVLVAIRFEERNLREFHPEYADYCKQVPMIIPKGVQTAQTTPLKSSVTV